MITFRGRGFSGIYPELINMLTSKKHTRTTRPRGKNVIEIVEPVSITLTQPWDCWLTLSQRRLNPFFAAAEIYWILSGKGSVDWIARFNENMRSFADPGKADFNAPYGKRIFHYRTLVEGDRMMAEGGTVDQFAQARDALLDDPATRRSVICLWHPVDDNRRDSLDLACNNLIYFSIRDGQLNTTVCQRSNDLIWGTPYNIIQFQHLAELMRGELFKFGIDVSRGWHTVVINNLHAYTDLYPGLLDRIGVPLKRRPVVFDQSVCRSRANLDLINQYIPELDKAPQRLPVWENERLTPPYWLTLLQLAQGYLYYQNSDGELSRGEFYRWCGHCPVRFLGWMAQDFLGEE